MINSHNDNPESCTVSQIIMFLWVLYHKNVHFLSLKATQALSHIIKTLEIYSRFQKKSNLWITSKSDSKFPKNIHVCVCTHMKMKFFLVEYRNSWVCMRVMAFDWFGPQFYVDIDKPLRIQYILVSHTRKILFSSNCSYFYLTLRLFYHCYCFHILSILGSMVVNLLPLPWLRPKPNSELWNSKNFHRMMNGILWFMQTFKYHLVFFLACVPFNNNYGNNLDRLW